jgi:hypothetical protein
VGASPAARRLISQQVQGSEEALPITCKCPLAGLSRASFYRHRRAGPPQKTQEATDTDLRAAMHRLALELTGCGYRRRSRRGNPYDNAKVESFFKRLKYEAVYLSDYQDLQAARQSIGHFLCAVYNIKRLHSSLGNLPPEEFEEQVRQQQQQQGAAAP